VGAGTADDDDDDEDNEQDTSNGCDDSGVKTDSYVSFREDLDAGIYIAVRSSLSWVQ
jgi:hypothetical protein